MLPLFSILVIAAMLIAAGLILHKPFAVIKPSSHLRTVKRKRGITLWYIQKMVWIFWMDATVDIGQGVYRFKKYEQAKDALQFIQEHNDRLLLSKPPVLNKEYFSEAGINRRVSELGKIGNGESLNTNVDFWKEYEPAKQIGFVIDEQKLWAEAPMDVNPNGFHSTAIDLQGHAEDVKRELMVFKGMLSSTVVISTKPAWAKKLEKYFQEHDIDIDKFVEQRTYGDIAGPEDGK